MTIVAPAPDGVRFRAEVFCDGLSLLDARTVAAAKADAPRPVSAFESWTAGPFDDLPSSQFAPRWVLVAGPLFTTMLVVGCAMGPEIAALGPLVAGACGFLYLFLRTWFVATSRARRHLLSRPELGDVARLALLAAVFVGIPIATGLVLIVALAMASLD